MFLDDMYLKRKAFFIRLDTLKTTFSLTFFSQDEKITAFNLN